MNHPNEPGNRTSRCSRKAILWLVVVFLLGAVTGIGGSLMVMARRFQSSFRHPELVEERTDRFIKRVGDDLEKHLDLNPQESAAVREELAKSKERLLGIRSELLKDVRILSGDTIDRIGRRLPEAKGDALRRHVRKRLEPWGLQPES